MIDLTGRTDVPVAEEVLAELAGFCHQLELEFLVVGAASRYHYARRAAEAFAPVDGRAVIDTLDDAQLRPVLLRHMRSGLSADLLDGYSKGFAAGLERCP